MDKPRTNWFFLSEAKNGGRNLCCLVDEEEIKAGMTSATKRDLPTDSFEKYRGFRNLFEYKVPKEQARQELLSLGFEEKTSDEVLDIFFSAKKATTEEEKHNKKGVL